MRMGTRRFTGLTNGFSKKVNNLKTNAALHYMHYNFARIHNTLRVTQDHWGDDGEWRRDDRSGVVLRRAHDQSTARQFTLSAEVAGAVIT
jgi:hypothetical protein